MKTVLVIDDCQDVLESVALVLDQAGFNVVCTSEVDRALELCNEVKFDLILCDLYLRQPATDTETLAGLDLIWSLSDQYPRLRLIAMSGAIEEGRLDNIKKIGVAGVLRKPFGTDLLLKEVANALQH